MTTVEKLTKIKAAYEMLIPCIVDHCIQDYFLVLTEAPTMLNELITDMKVAQLIDESEQTEDETERLRAALEEIENACELGAIISPKGPVIKSIGTMARKALGKEIGS